MDLAIVPVADMLGLGGIQSIILPSTGIYGVYLLVRLEKYLVLTQRNILNMTHFLQRSHALLTLVRSLSSFLLLADGDFGSLVLVPVAGGVVVCLGFPVTWTHSVEGGRSGG
jgi:hypothetical protein